MQVEKQHYLIKLLLAIVIYISFAIPEGKNLRLVTVVILNTLLFQGIYHNSKWMKLPLVLGTLFEILSSNTIGIFLVKYLWISYIIIFCKENFKTINLPILLIVTTFAFSSAVSLEVTIKAFLGFPLSYLWYKNVVIFTVTSILITTYIYNMRIYRHLK